jgi:NAD(P)-dependent dehydrogenase (short-subunit alcohol dehydrogenase family)
LDTKLFSYPDTPAGLDPQQWSRNQHQLRGRQDRNGHLWSLRSTKFALEAVSDALRREVEPLGVKVIVVEPGAVTTEMLGRVAATGERITNG